MQLFNFDEFEKRFLSKKTDERNVFAAYQISIDKLYEEGRAGNASALECSLQSYSKKEVLFFDAVTVDFLNGYEKFMVVQGKSLTTVGIYLRALHTLFNEAIEKRIVNPDLYPFGKRRYQIPSGRNIKKALSLAEIGKIFHYQANETTKEAWARDMWVFSYLCSGINVKDIARLIYRDITNNQLRNDLATLNQTISRLPLHQIDMNEKGFKKFIRTYNREVEIMNNQFPP